VSRSQASSGAAAAADVPHFAFFDVDETLIAPKSMLSFLDFLDEHAPAGLLSPDAVVAFRVASAAAERAGVLREELNRRYYQTFAGASVVEVAVWGRRWYRAVRSALRDRFFIAPTRAALAAHAENGAHLVLVSGSFRACLDPLVDELSLPLAVLCAQPAVDAGRYTGELATPPTIGAGKAHVAAAWARAHPEVSLARSYAYGDHVSDLPLLELVGHPHVVPGCLELVATARTRGWPVLELDHGNSKGDES
jgi:HAD superfamily hydrolase (TIGR01490 family)